MFEIEIVIPTMVTSEPLVVISKGWTSADQAMAIAKAVATEYKLLTHVKQTGMVIQTYDFRKPEHSRPISGSATPKSAESDITQMTEE